MNDLIGRTTPSFFQFDPTVIPWQYSMLDEIDSYNYDHGMLEIMLSGSIGSAKSLVAAHALCRHAIENPGARVIMGRRALPDVKKTMFATVVEHLESEELKEGKDYFLRENVAEIRLRNGSEFLPYYWADKKFKRVRSINASSGWIEELTENDEKDSKAFFEMKARLGRLPIREKFLLGCTNPDSPAHWAHKYFIEGSKGSINRRVYYSNTRQNPFLPASYIDQLERDLDPKEARRLLHGEWIEIDSERVYHSYDAEHNYKNESYDIRKDLPIILAFDFNIGQGKPMSSVAMQWDGFMFHIFDEVVVQGARTPQTVEDWVDKGIHQHGCKLLIRGDASGDARDTRSILTDYDLIKKLFLNSGAIIEMQVPKSNPPIRKRHNLVNGYCLNVKGQRRLTVYKDAKVAHDGMRLTALKTNGDYIEDDSKSYQHVTTAIGYGIVYEHNNIGNAQVSSSRR